MDKVPKIFDQVKEGMKGIIEMKAIPESRIVSVSGIADIGLSYWQPESLFFCFASCATCTQD